MSGYEKGIANYKLQYLIKSSLYLQEGWEDSN